MNGTIPSQQRAQADRALPGISPVGQADWITVDQCYAAQIAEKRRLLAERPGDVLAMTPAAEAVADELLAEVVALLAGRSDFSVAAEHVTCPDGREVDLRGDPMWVLSHLIQEDLCIHLRQRDVHHLMGALLCFPASWTLAEKIGKPLIGVHAPVAEYDTDLAARVQRLFDGVQVGQPLWRANWLRYDDPSLYQPRAEGNPRPVGTPQSGFARSERQTLFRLPESGAVVFAIHTTVAQL